jgi:hypothetical protein
MSPAYPFLLNTGAPEKPGVILPVHSGETINNVHDLLVLKDIFSMVAGVLVHQNTGTRTTKYEGNH